MAPTSFVKTIVFIVLGIYFSSLSSRLYSQTAIWRPSEDTIFDGGTIWSLFADDSVVLAGTSQNLFRSLDNGNSWQQASFDSTIQEQRIWVNSIIRHHNILFAGTINSVLCSFDNGSSWSDSHLKITMTGNEIYPFRLLSFGNSIFVLKEQSTKLYRSNNNGQSWNEVTNLPLPSSPSSNSPLKGLTAQNGKIFLAGNRAVFYSDDNGISWKSSGDIGLRDFDQIRTIKATQNHIFIMSNSELHSLSLETMKWQRLLAPSGINLTDIIETESHLFIVGGGNMSRRSSIVFRSSDKGQTWIESSSGLDPQITFGIANYIAANTKTVFIGTPGGVFKMDKGNQTWQFASRSLQAQNIRTICTTEKSLLFGMGMRIARTSNNGLSTTVFQPQLEENIIGEIVTLTYTNGVLLGARYGQLLRSTNDGQTWQPLLSPQIVTKLHSTTKGFYAATLGGIYFSPTADFWQSLVNLPQVPFRDITSSNDALFALTESGQLFTSKDNGTTWQNLQQVFSDGVKALSTVGSNIFVQTTGRKIFHSADNGNSWTSMTETTPLDFTSLFALNSRTILGFASNAPGLFRSLDMGVTWHSFTGGLPDRLFVNAIARNNTTLFMGTMNGLYSMGLEKATGVNTNATSAKESFVLAFPNPMRDIGTISYTLDQAGNVHISLINALGQTVSILHDATQNAGEHSIAVDASRYAAGVYTVRIETGIQTARTNIVVLP